MSDQDLTGMVCNEMVYPRERYGSFKGHRCCRPAKALCVVGENMETGNKIQGYRCGIHAKRYAPEASLGSGG